MFIRSRLRAVTAALAVVAVAVPVVAAGPASADIPMPSLPGVTGLGTPNVCFSNLPDPGPLGPSGPYGAQGPYGPNGPLHNSPNPLGNVANCGGALAFFLRGGTVSSFVQANLQSVGH
jgi:hypothetical protein